MWQKQGVIFSTDHNQPWMVSHACVPTIHVLNDNTFESSLPPVTLKDKAYLHFWT